MPTDREKLERILYEFSNDSAHSRLGSHAITKTAGAILALAPSPPANRPVMVDKGKLKRLLRKEMPDSNTRHDSVGGMEFLRERLTDSLMSLFAETGTEQVETRPADTVEAWAIAIQMPDGERLYIGQSIPSRERQYRDQKIVLGLNKEETEEYARDSSFEGRKCHLVRVLLPALEDKEQSDG